MRSARLDLSKALGLLFDPVSLTDLLQLVVDRTLKQLGLCSERLDFLFGWCCGNCLFGRLIDYTLCDFVLGDERKSGFEFVAMTVSFGFASIVLLHC